MCPWWLAYLFDNPLRRLMQPVEQMVAPYLSPGMTVLDFGCGFGHFSLGMAPVVGPTGQVIAADIQSKMLDIMTDRARKAGLDGVICPHQCGCDGLGVRNQVDFVLAGNVLHETPDPAKTLTELFAVLKPGGRFLLVEPPMHLKQTEFDAEVALATAAGFVHIDSPNNRPMCAVFSKPTDGALT